jgi:tetratricopeptide (TPR) repeat protein
LELEPQNPVARQQLAHSYAQEGSRLSMWGMYDEALKIYEEGLSHVPNSQELLVMVGGTYADQKNLAQARSYLDRGRAINPDDLSTLHTMFMIWLSNDFPQEAAQTFAYTQAVSTPVPGAFYLDLAEHCDEYDQPELARQILDYIEKRYQEDENVLVGVAMLYINVLDDDRRAVPILRRVLQKNPDHIEANMQLGVAYHFMDQSRLAQRHWNTAENLARKNKDHLLLHRIKLMKDELLYGKMPPSNPLEMLINLPPQVREQLMQTAPPEIAEIMRDMSPEEMELLMQMAAGFGDEFFDEDDF